MNNYDDTIRKLYLPPQNENETKSIEYNIVETTILNGKAQNYQLISTICPTYFRPFEYTSGIQIPTVLPAIKNEKLINSLKVDDMQ